MRNLLFISFCFCLLFAISPFSTDFSEAATVDELQEQIRDREAKIAELEKDIQKYKQEIQGTSAQKQTLNAKIAELEATQRKLEKELSVTQNQIEATELSIEKLGHTILTKEEQIDLTLESIGESIRVINKSDQTALIEIVLKFDSMSEFWGAVSSVEQIQSRLRDQVYELRGIKKELEEDREETIEKKEDLENLENDLSKQEDVVAYNKGAQTTLLTQTQNKEAEFQKLLRTKEEQRDAFLRELSDLESKINVIYDKNAVPQAGSNVFAPPLADVAKISCWEPGGLDFGNCITQYFGNTPFAQSGAYNGKTHNGADFRAVVGEKLFSPGGGIVKATGNTDVGRCLSYGKWILVEHDNGLTNLFAHLSAISVTPGQQVSTGTTLGFTGATGYATGPHLHMSTFPSDAVQVINIGDWYRESGRAATSPCSAANVRIPVAPHDAYLNPLSYL